MVRLALPRACLQACSCELELPRALPCLALLTRLAAASITSRCLPPCKFSGRGAGARAPTSARRRGHANAREHQQQQQQPLRTLLARQSGSEGSATEDGAGGARVVACCWLLVASRRWRRAGGRLDCGSAAEGVGRWVAWRVHPPPFGDVHWLHASLPRVWYGQALLSSSVGWALGPQQLPTCDPPLATSTEHKGAAVEQRTRAAAP
jgi:hypothetical protein